jgi:hypothetical protein
MSYSLVLLHHTHTSAGLLMEIKSLGTSDERLVQSKEAKDQTRPVCVFQKHTTFFGFDVITKGGAN